MSEVASYAPTWESAGGDPGACVSEADPDTNWSFYRAPGAFLGDQSEQSGHGIRFSVRTSHTELSEGRLVILIGGGFAISHMIPEPEIGEWSRHRISLSEGAWVASSVGAGPVASQTTIDAVLADLGEFLIGMEYGSDVLEEIVSLDTVLLGVCTADLVPPYGALNFFDIQQYITDYLAESPSADLAAPFGAFNFFDIQTYIGLYVAGCP